MPSRLPPLKPARHGLRRWLAPFRTAAGRTAPPPARPAPREPLPGAILATGVAAARALEGHHPAPIILGYHPVERTNPYQRLLYREAWPGGMATLGLATEAQADELGELAAAGHRVVLHLHWLNRTVGQATDPADAAVRTDAFLARIDRLRTAGVRLAWTVHNLLPHATRLEAQERALRSAVAERADVIHVMAAGTAGLIAPYQVLPPDRILHVPHPSYDGVYPDLVPRGPARLDLRLEPDDLVFLALGSIKPYKGLGDLLDAWDHVPAGRPRRLVVAGRPSSEPGIDALLDRLGAHPDVRLLARHVAADEVGPLLRAADVAVLPYRRTLNSGALLLALTFGLPAVVPAGTGLAELVDERNGLTYAAGDRSALATTLHEAERLATPDARAAARATAERFDPRILSAAFVAGLRDRLGWS